jgi:hypothetical protein
MAATALPPIGTAPPRTVPALLPVVAGLVALLLVALAVVGGAPGAIGGGVLLNLGLVAFAAHRYVLRWHALAVAVVLCLLLIPIGRYDFPVTLPFNMEPYRALVMVVALLWLASLLGQPGTTWRRTGMFLPLFAVAVTIIVSVGFNIDRLSLPGVQGSVVKQVSMFASFIFVLLFMATVIETRDQLHAVIKALVAGGAVVSFFSLVQYHSGFNLFDHLDKILPILRLVPGGIPDHIEARGGGARIYGSAPHPIALSAALVMLLPLGIYLARAFGGRVWISATALIAIASMATVARTGSVMLMVTLVTYLVLRPRPLLKLWPWVLPFLVVTHFAAPEAIGGLKSAFFPSGGLVAEQQTQGGMTSSNRLADIGPTLTEWSRKPAFGQGFGTRITAPRDPNLNAAILDDQWLATLLETGLFGFLSVLWLTVSSIRRTGSAARGDPSDFGWLLVGLTATMAGFAVGAVTFDAFSFFQCTFLMFAVMGIAIAARRLSKPPPKRGPVALVC